MYDVNLELDPGSTVSADGNTTAIDTEGDVLCWCNIKWGAMSGGSTTLDTRVQYSPDGGSNYYMCPGGKFQQLGPTNDNAFMRIPVYIPPPATAGNPVKVRLNDDVAGSSPSYARTKAWLEPILPSPAIPATDKSLAEGLLSQLAAV